jgi:hypothetical protein
MESHFKHENVGEANLLNPNHHNMSTSVITANLPVDSGRKSIDSYRG